MAASNQGVLGPAVRFGWYAVFGLIVATVALPGPASGQWEGLPPVITITEPPDQSVTNDQTPEIRVDYHKDFDCSVPQMPGEPDPCDPDESTLLIKVNGVDQTDSFTKHGTYANTTSVVLPDEQWSTIYAKICNVYGCDEDTIQVYVQTLPAPPLVSTEPHNGDVLSPDLCEGCFDLITIYSTPPYFSLDVPRSLTLFYSSHQAAPRGLVAVDAWDPPQNPDPPNQMSIRLQRPDGSWVTFTNNSQEIYYTYTEDDTLRLTVQFDATGLSSGAYSYSAVVRSWWGLTSKETTVPVRVLVLNERQSGIASGWTVAGMQTLIPQGDTLVVLLDGAGGIAAFESVGSDRFESARADFSEIQKTGSGTYVRLWADSTKTFFGTQADGAIRADSIRDRFGNVTEFDYFTTTGNLRSIQDPMGQAISLSYSTSWQGLWTINSGRLTTLTCDPITRDLLSVQDPDGVAQSFTYDTNHRMETFTDREGATTDYTYDNWSRLSTIQLAEVTLYDSSNVRPAVNLSAPEQRAIPSSGGTSLSDPAPGVQATDIYGLLVGARDDTTRIWFNGLGKTVKAADPLGHALEAEYNSDGLPLVVMQPSGQRIEFSWNGDKLTHHEIVGLRFSEYTYESTYGQLKTVKVQGNLAETYYYDPVQRVDSVKIAGVPSAIRYFFDERGRDILVEDLAGHATQFYFDDTLGNIRWILNPALQTHKLERDMFGRVHYAVSLASDTTEFVYDPINRVTAVYDPVNPNPTRTHYGPIYADSITDPKNERYRFVRNVLGWVTERYGPASSVKSDRYGYDVDGSLRCWTNRNDRTVDYDVDLLGRITKITAGGQTIDFGYDPSGHDRFKWGSNAWSTDTLWYTQAGLLDSTKAVRNGTPYVVDYEYAHWSGRPTRINDRHNSRALDFVYNEQGQLDTLKVRGVKSYVDLRNSDRFTLTRSYPALFDQTFKYTTNHHIGEIKWGNMLSRGLGRDGLGRVELLDPEGDTVYKYAYDDLGRLERSETYTQSSSCSFDPDSGTVCDPGALSLVSADTFTYDELGNQTEGGPLGPAQIDPGSRLTSNGLVTFTYDYAGNVVGRESPLTSTGATLYWSPLGQLDSVVKYFNGVTTSRHRYKYDAFGRRIQQSDDTSTVDYVWAMGHVLFDVRDGTTTEYSYWPGTDRLHSIYRESTFYYFLTDHLGSVLGIADNNANVLNSYEYGVWGQNLSSTGSLENRMRYAGRERDFSGFYYHRSRYYDSGTGRYLSEDPIGLSGGLNPYAYAANNPLTLRDPLGLQGEPDDDDCPPGVICIEGITVEYQYCPSLGAVILARAPCPDWQEIGELAQWYEELTGNVETRVSLTLTWGGVAGFGLGTNLTLIAESEEDGGGLDLQIGWLGLTAAVLPLQVSVTEGMSHRFRKGGDDGETWVGLVAGGSVSVLPGVGVAEQTAIGYGGHDDFVYSGVGLVPTGPGVFVFPLTSRHTLRSPTKGR